MKKIIFTLMMILPLLAGCMKSGQDEVSGATEKMIFSGSMPGTRSHFASYSESSQLYWDGSDRIAVYMSPVSDAFFGESRYLTNISESMGISTLSDNALAASFRSKKDKEAWFTEPLNHSIYDDYYQYFAYYPCAGDPGAVSVWDNDGRYFQYLPFNIPENQDGSSYGDYQILYDPGLAENENEYGEDPAAWPYILSKSAVIGAASSVELTQFKPVTSLLRFTLKAPEYETYHITSVEISLVGDYEGLSLAGDARLLLNQYGDQDRVPIAWQKTNGMNYLQPVETGKNTIHLTFPYGYGVSYDDSWGKNYLYAVTIPFKTTNSGVSIKFTAKDDLGNYYVCRKPLPQWSEDKDTFYGFQEGCRYKTEVTLKPVDLDPESVGAGRYEAGDDDAFTVID